jgi:hypothetical protein
MKQLDLLQAWEILQARAAAAVAAGAVAAVAVAALPQRRQVMDGADGNPENLVERPFIIDSQVVVAQKFLGKRLTLMNTEKRLASASKKRVKWKQSCCVNLLFVKVSHRFCLPLPLNVMASGFPKGSFGVLLLLLDFLLLALLLLLLLLELRSFALRCGMAKCTTI